MYLVDTNIWLERLLGQEKSEQVAQFLDFIPSDRLFMTDFAFHSIGIIMDRLEQMDAFLRFTQDCFEYGSVVLVHLLPEDTYQIKDIMNKFKMDFDDAYQYVAADKYNLIIVSFDNCFEHTDLGRKTPLDIIRN